MILSLITSYLGDISSVGYLISLAVSGAACLRLSKRGADRWFAAAAWAAFIGVPLLGLDSLLYYGSFLIFQSSPPFRPFDWLVENFSLFQYVIYIAYDVLAIVHFALFAAGAFRTARKLGAAVPR